MSGLLIDNPIRLKDVAQSINVIPGDTLMLRAGTYTGDWIFKFSGTEANPITIKPYSGEVVKIDGPLTLNGNYIIIMDMEIFDSGTDRTLADATDGVVMNYPGCKLIGCDIHDQHSTGINWFGSGVGELVECMIRNNGLRYTDGVGHGHGIYTHNNNGGARLIARNLIFDQIGDYTLQIYSSSANYLKDYTVEDNIIAGDPVTTGGGKALIDFVYQRNIQWGDYCQQGRWAREYQNVNGQIANNIFIGLQAYSVNADCDLPWDNLTEADNLVYGGEPADRAGYTQIEIPATLTKLTAFTKSERWLGSLAVFNRDSAATVAVDFTGTLANGDYLLRNGQNPAETWPFTCAGEAINVPMDTTTWTPATRIGDNMPGAIFPVFGAFVIEAA